MADGVRLTVLGSNGTYPTPGRPASGYLVADGDDLVWLDTGPGTLAVAISLDAVERLSAVVVSHIHPDHCSDLFMLFNLLRVGPRDRWGLPVVVPEGAADHLRRFARAGPDHDFDRVFDFRTVDSGDGVAVGDLRLRFGTAAHPVPSLVTRVEGSSSLVYSGDTGPGGDLASMSGGASTLLCEATHQGDPPADRYPYHLHAVEAGAVATEAGVGRLLVTHVAPTLDPQVSVAEAARVFAGPVAHAHPSMEVDV